MFTGIIDQIGRISHIQSTPSGIRFKIATSYTDIQAGESISVDGVCLTALSSSSLYFECDLSPETLKLTTAEHYQLETRVNLERALMPQTRMGGHYVTGHVDQTAKLSRLVSHGEFIEMAFEGIDPHQTNLLVKKGSITVNGVSLTVNELGASENGTPSFSVMLIPHTLEKTNLNTLKVGDSVNLEFDWMTKVVVREVQNVLKNLKESECKMNLPR